MQTSGQIRFRRYGDCGPEVVVLHGGPAAVGSVAAVARGLADSFRVIEPWQRGSGDQPLTVDTHIADLRELISNHCDDPRPALIGWSWGAMLALAYASEHPDMAGPLVLVGCGTFDPVARARLQEILAERLDDDVLRKLDRLADEYPNPGEQLKRRYELTQTLYHYDPDDSLPDDDPGEPFDLKAHTETWDDMVRQQENGRFPAAFAAIKSPVIMLHGAYDPHPGVMIRDSLVPFLPQLEYREWEHCGHTPWIEKRVRAEFFAVLKAWLSKSMGL